MSDQPKVAIMFSNYGPYHFARVNGFHAACSRYGVQCVAIEVARSEETYAWVTSIDHIAYPFISIIPDKKLEDIRLFELIKQVITTLNTLNPTVLAIAGYFHPAMLTALLWCRWHRRSAILLSESKEDDAPRKQWQEAIKQLILKGFQSALVGGQPQKRYLEKLGMHSESIFYGYNVVGNADFHVEKLQLLPNPIQKPFFLSVSRFVTKKNLPNLLKAYAKYCQGSGSLAWDLVLCGDGELRPQLEKQVQIWELQNHVHFPGFLQIDGLRPYYAHASCFILPSIQEQWGLVVNEAMAAGLPVLVSNRCGCYEDLVIEGVNGFGFDPEDTDELAQRLTQISSSTVNLKAMGEAGLQRIEKFSPAYFAEGLHQAVKYAGLN